MVKQEHWVSARGCVYNIYYHLVWSTKYRKKLLDDDIAKRLKERCEDLKKLLPEMMKSISGSSCRGNQRHQRLTIKHPAVLMNAQVEYNGTREASYRLYGFTYQH